MRLHWKETAQKYFWLVCFILISYNVLWQSLSRTGYIVYFLLLLIFSWQHVSIKKAMLGTVGVIIVFMLVLFSSSNFKAGLGQVSHNEKQALQGHLKTSTGIRYGYLLNSITLWKHAPLVGNGTGSYRYWSPKIDGITAGGGVSTVTHSQTTPENTYYRILVEHGLLGVVVLLGFWFWQLFIAFKMKDALYRNVAIGFMATMFVASMSQDLLLDESPRLFYILFTCLLYSPLVMKKLPMMLKRKSRA